MAFRISVFSVRESQTVVTDLHDLMGDLVNKIRCMTLKVMPFVNRRGIYPEGGYYIYLRTIG